MLVGFTPRQLVPGSYLACQLAGQHRVLCAWLTLLAELAQSVIHHFVVEEMKCSVIYIPACACSQAGVPYYLSEE